MRLSVSSPLSLSASICPSPFPLMHFEQHTELDNLIAMQNLRTSANKGSNDAYDVSVSLTVQVRGMYLFTISYGSHSMDQRMELVESVDELRTSSSFRGISMPKVVVLDARIASALNRIIHNSNFTRRISLEEQKSQKLDSFLRGRQIAYLIYDHSGVIGTMILSRTTPTCSPLFFEMTIFRNSFLSGTESYCP